MRFINIPGEQKMTYSFISSLCQNLSRPSVLKLACLVITSLIVWQIVSSVRSIIAIPEPVTMSAPSTVIIKKPSQAPSNAGLSAPFFGTYVPEMKNVSDVKKSLLTYKVVGIMLADRDEDSEVIIDTLSGGDVIFHVGDMLPWGTMIKKITSDGIFVERNGELESLSFPKNELIFEPPAKPMQ